MAYGPSLKIYINWTKNYDIHLCSKGFFVIKFDISKDLDYALNEGSRFWGSVGLFMIPWFLGFDVNSIVLSKLAILGQVT